MGWVLVSLLIFSLIGNIIRYFIKLNEDAGITWGAPERKRIDFIWKVLMIIGIALVSVLILYVLGWLWYIFCGGFLLWMEDVWYMKIVYGFMSLIFLSILIGVIAIIFGGWKPYK